MIVSGSNPGEGAEQADPPCATCGIAHSHLTPHKRLLDMTIGRVKESIDSPNESLSRVSESR